MGILISILTVFFVIVCVLLVIVVLLQSDKSAGMGLLGASSQSAFGSSTADVITKITTVMVAMFMIGSLGLSILESQGVSDKDKQKQLFDKKVSSDTINKSKDSQAESKDQK